MRFYSFVQSIQLYCSEVTWTYLHSSLRHILSLSTTFLSRILYSLHKQKLIKFIFLLRYCVCYSCSNTVVVGYITTFLGTFSHHICFLVSLRPGQGQAMTWVSSFCWHWRNKSVFSFVNTFERDILKLRSYPRLDVEPSRHRRLLFC